MPTADLLSAARGDRPSDLLFAGGRVVNVFTGEIEEVDVAVADGFVVGMGDGYEARRTVELGGRLLLPGLVDAHVHIESSLLAPPGFARAVLPRGTTTVVTDPHEIANVHGLAGVRYMLEASEGLPLQVYVMASSCVPATPMGTAGAELDAAALAGLADHPRVLGLAEVMNFPGVIQGDPGVLEKIRAFRGRAVDGHAPGVRGKALNAYVVGGPGSDHEATTAGEAREKLRRGLHLFFREASNARNLGDLLPALDAASARRVCLCTDDRTPPDLLDEGGIDAMLREVIRSGAVDPVEAVRLATLNPAEYFGLRDRGAVGPGRRADLLVVDGLEELRVDEVWAGGRRVARDGVGEGWPAPRIARPDPAMAVDLDRVELEIPDRGSGPVRVIGAVRDQIVTEHLWMEPRVADGALVADPERDLLKIAVVERHRGSGRVGRGFVSGLGLRRGALASTVAHDHHNLMTAGADDRSMRTALAEVVRLGGGLAVAEEDRVLASLALPVGGLMSDAPVGEVRRDFDRCLAAARELGAAPRDPFMALSFLGLEVIPALKITDRGLVDVDAFRLVPLRE